MASDTREGLRKRGDTWTALWWVTGPDGVARQRSKGGFRTRKEAKAHRTEQLAAIDAGTYSEPTDRNLTVAAFLRDHWLPSVRASATRSGAPRRPSTLESYRIAVESWLIPHIGAARLVALTPRHVETIIDTLTESGNRYGKPLKGRSVQYAYTVLRMAIDHAQRRGYVPRNVVAQVGRPGATKSEMTSWTAAEAQTFLRATETDRLYAAWVLLLARGPRRGDVAGLRWDMVDLDAGTLRITRTRISIGGTVAESTPKTEAGRRMLHLDAGLVAVLRKHRTRQRAEQLAAGSAWADSGHVFTTELGAALHPEHLSNRFGTLCRKAEVRRIRLHECRHSAASLMLADGTPVKVVQEMLGHSNPAITQGMYQHVLPGMGEQAGARQSAALGIRPPTS